MQLPRLLKPISAVVALAAAAVCPLGASAAGTGDATFSKTGAPFSFRYPSSFQIAPYHGGTKLNRPTYQVALGVDAHDYLLVQTYRLKISVDRDGSGRGPDGNPLTTKRVDQIVDATIGQLTASAGFGDQAPATTGRLGALRARVYHVMKHDRSLASTIVVALSGRTEYYLACQATPGGQTRVTQACSRLVATFAAR